MTVFLVCMETDGGAFQKKFSGPVKWECYHSQELKPDPVYPVVLWGSNNFTWIFSLEIILLSWR